MRTFLFATIVSFFFFFPTESLKGASVSFSNNKLPVIQIEAEASTGINDIFVLSELDGVSITYSADSNSQVEWLRYSNLGGGYAETISGIVKNGNEYTLENPEGNMGYIIRENNRDYVFWLTDYAKFTLNLESLSIDGESGCDQTVLSFSGNADPIHYYTVNGRQETLSRDLMLSYYNLDWNDTDKNYNQSEIIKTLPSISNSIVITPPVYCQTGFQLIGDRFLESWGITQTISSGTYSPVAVEVNSSVEADSSSESGDNVINGNSDSLGGSAPFTATFYSYSTDAVIHNEWQMANDPEFEDITHRINDADLTYTFRDEGTVYVRFVGSNYDGSCESVSDTYTINIGASELLIPNAFSPNGDGINDIWKVAYRSLVSFKCHIFNRHGHQIYQFDDPNGGWDGKNGSKFVNPGVYFYVIEAVGSDGKKYKRSGDINIIGSHKTSQGTIEE